jgi:hypothetical protein
MDADKAWPISSGKSNPVADLMEYGQREPWSPPTRLALLIGILPVFPAICFYLLAVVITGGKHLGYGTSPPHAPLLESGGSACILSSCGMVFGWPILLLIAHFTLNMHRRQRLVFVLAYVVALAAIWSLLLWDPTGVLDWLFD